MKNLLNAHKLLPIHMKNLIITKIQNHLSKKMVASWKLLFEV